MFGMYVYLSTERQSTIWIIALFSLIQYKLSELLKQTKDVGSESLEDSDLYCMENSLDLMFIL